MESEVEVTLGVETVGDFKWTDANTADLIVWRVTNRNLFTGKRNTALKSFELFVKENQLEGKVTPAWVKKKWENLRQKYKDIKSLGLYGGHPPSAPWKWYTIMDQALGGEIITPSLLSCPVNASTPFALPVQVSSSAKDAPPIKKRKEEYWLVALNELEKRQEEREVERERRAAEREEERDRRAVEREMEREKQALEREKRREQEILARQERWEKELLAREERREKEYKEREERRDREAAVREDRMFKLMETFISKK